MALKDLLKVEGVLIGSKNIVLLVAGAKVWIHCKGLFVFISIKIELVEYFNLMLID